MLLPHVWSVDGALFCSLLAFCIDARFVFHGYHIFSRCCFSKLFYFGLNYTYLNGSSAGSYTVEPVRSKCVLHNIERTNWFDLTHRDKVILRFGCSDSRLKRLNMQIKNKKIAKAVLGCLYSIRFLWYFQMLKSLLVCFTGGWLSSPWADRPVWWCNIPISQQWWCSGGPWLPGHIACTRWHRRREECPIQCSVHLHGKKDCPIHRKPHMGK